MPPWHQNRRPSSSSQICLASVKHNNNDLLMQPLLFRADHP